GQRRPPRASGCQVELDVRGHRADLSPRIQDEGRADAIDPAARGGERRLVYVAAHDQRGLVLLDPATELTVAVEALSRPARLARARRRVVRPQPRAIADERGVVGQLAFDVRTAARAVPPRAHRDHSVLYVEPRAVDREPVAACGLEPDRRPFAVGILGVEI